MRIYPLQLLACPVGDGERFPL